MTSLTLVPPELPFIYFGASRIRIAAGTGADAWLVAADVAEALGVAQHGGRFVMDLPEAPKGVPIENTLCPSAGTHPIPTAGGTQEVRTVNMAGFLDLVHRSRTPVAQEARGSLLKAQLAVLGAGPAAPQARVRPALGPAAARLAQVEAEIREEQTKSAVLRAENDLAELRGQPLPHPDLFVGAVRVLMDAFRAGPRRGLTRTQIRDVFGRHGKASVMEGALAELKARGLVRMTRVKSNGRPVELWTLTRWLPELQS